MKLGELVRKLRLEPDWVTAVLGDVLGLENREPTRYCAPIEIWTLALFQWLVRFAGMDPYKLALPLMHRIAPNLKVHLRDLADKRHFSVGLYDGRAAGWNDHPPYDYLERRQLPDGVFAAAVTAIHLDLSNLVHKLIAEDGTDAPASGEGVGVEKAPRREVQPESDRG